MHSAILRGSDFKIRSDGLTVSHTAFFSNFNIATRLGLITRDRHDGIGAANLILAFVTAFYDRQRELAKQFYAYPEFYTFQSGSEITDYGMLDIYPIEKNIKVENRPESILSAVIEKKIDILLIPHSSSNQSDITSRLLAEIQQSVHTCILYSATGEVDNPNLTIECDRTEIFDWLKELSATIPKDSPDNLLSSLSQPAIKQSFCIISTVSALSYI